MISMTKITGKLVPAVVILAALLLMLGTASQVLAQSAACLAGGGDAGLSTNAECVINSTVPPPGTCPYVLTLGGGVDPNESLRLTSTGSIDCGDPAAPPGAGAQPITISVAGDMVMQTGSSIRAENSLDGGNGGNITLTVGGDFTMRGTSGGTAGAVISSSKTSDRQQPGREHPDHRRQRDGQPGRPDHHVRHDARGRHPGGERRRPSSPIMLMAWRATSRCLRARTPRSTALVLSVGLLGEGKGGQITIDACCDLVVGDTGRSSAGAGIPAPTWCTCRGVSSRSSGSWRPPVRRMSRRSPMSVT